MHKIALALLISSLFCLPVMAQFDPVFEPDNCPMPLPAGEIDGETVICGYVSVPETRGAPDSEEVSLAVAVLRSAGPAQPDPIIYLSGGPGSSALLEIADWAQSPLRANRDIILFDQRGTGYSMPTLDCREYALNEADPDRVCYERLRRSGINLAAYNSAASAADIADLRRALELDAVNLYGVSYGTRLALTVLRDVPEGVRSVVLDSVYPPQIDGLNEQAPNGVQAIQRLFAACANDPACEEAYGDLESAFYELVAELNTSPYPTTDPETQEPIDLTGDDLVNLLFEALYTSSAIPTLPYGIFLLAGGDYTYGLDILSGAYTLHDLQTLEMGGALPEDELIDVPADTPDGDSEGMFHAVECYEEVPFNDPQTVERLAAGLPPLLAKPLKASTAEQFTLCAWWDSRPGDRRENQPVSSAVPTLLLSGSFDPITPPAWAEAAAAYLSRSTHIEFPYAGHSILDSGPCAVQIIRAFLDDPLREPDTSCIDADHLTFYVPEICEVTALDDADLRAGPGEDYRLVDQLDAGETDWATAYASDGEYYWLRLEDLSWVREDIVDFPDSCFMLPFLEE